MTTFLSARYANEDHTAVDADTADTLHIIISERDRPMLWAELMASGVKIAPYVPIAPQAATVADKLASVGLSIDDLKVALGLAKVK